jgi:general secretion pathway protein I
MKSISKHAGFTLIEVLIALAILAIALTATMRAASVATDSANETKLRTLATWIAQNRIAEINALSVTSLPSVGESNGRQAMANIEFEWKQKISNTPNTAFRKVEVQVLRPGNDQWLANLSGFVVKASP